MMLACYHFFLVIFNILAGSEVEILTKSRVFVANMGSILNLQCAFICSNFNFFDNPMLWMKTQLNEQTQINMMGNLLEPFESSGRFKVAFNHQSTSYSLELFISHLVVEDSGNYTCQVKGPHNKLLNSVTHFLFVRSAVEVISLSLISSDVDRRRQIISEQKHQLIFVEKVPTTISCRATGGYPPPDLTIQFDESDVTDEFYLQHKIILGGTKPLRRLIFTSWRRKVGAMIRNDNGVNITCAATVPGLLPNSTSAIIAVHHLPSIKCDETRASPRDKNIFIKCIIISKPLTRQLYWIIDEKGTKLSEGDFINGHWTQNIIKSDGSTENKLYILKIRPENFRTYKIVANNIIGNQSEEVLIQKRHFLDNGVKIKNKEHSLRDQAPAENILQMVLRSDTRRIKFIWTILFLVVIII